ncbi:MAG TPA: hypothetical protein VGM43_11655, partial [Bryobacteraceae bacterium]
AFRGSCRVSEQDIFTGLFSEARRNMLAASQRKPYPPRMMLASVRAMGRHLEYSDAEIGALLEPAILHQLFLPPVLGTSQTILAEVPRHLPHSFEQMRRHVSAQKHGGPVVVLMFHFSGMPLVGSLLHHAWLECGFVNQHLLIAPRNASWLSHEHAHWLREAAETIVADRAGLRRLMTGLRNGGISHLTLLADGPHDPASFGVTPVARVPALGFRTGMLRWLFSSGITVIPLIHYWETERLHFEWRDPLSPENGVESVAGLIGELLRRHPEQWLNWPAASLRT